MVCEGVILNSMDQRVRRKRLVIARRVVFYVFVSSKLSE